MIIYCTHKEVNALKDFFVNLPNTELARMNQMKFSDVRMVPLGEELLYEMEKNIERENIKKSVSFDERKENK